MKIGAFGEVMLRLTPPEYLMLEQTHTLRVAYTGTGVNLVGNLAHFGIASYLLTALPENRLGDAALANLRSLGIDTTYVIQQEQHIGTYFAEMGHGVRPTEITYQNRKYSSFGLSNIEDYQLEEFVATVDLVHICGISLSLTDHCAEVAIAVAKKAYHQGKKVCFDFNFRPSLNREPRKRAVLKQRYEEILPYCTILFGSIRDLTELLEWPVDTSKAVTVESFQEVLTHYGIEWFTGTNRQTVEDKKQLSGYLLTPKAFVETPAYTLDSLDRIGTGDAFAAGILLGYAENWTLEQTILFALGNARLAHTIQGDVPLTTRKQVNQLLMNPAIDLNR
ncbi:hypothetical protein A5844_001856 [Enterococcus sp. 10A9_DIV0425]|uniref:Carbohydrate kinase PfkB domain-containing protein n=1 Tax=Candidatus Enterococcus wittei TaxID=1987383 RepID=A0A242JXW5_9ENTE|nr:sugar kinase [Enterococcus sp. 10A9_DIV0425]OTP10158.1 hypothetical protein A5844_001856 [Enterococcus sp. 10A9_DIV0425]THE12382.1 sugar kinase [Enterococcus hirae]